MGEKEPQRSIEVVIHAPTQRHRDGHHATLPERCPSILTRLHAGYFRITLSLGCQALLWKTLTESAANNSMASYNKLHLFPSFTFQLIWCLALVVLLLLSLLYTLRCIFRFHMVKAEFLHPLGVNYLFAPWISWLLLLQSAPLIAPDAIYYQVIWWVFVFPIMALDVKIYGQWFTAEKRFLSMLANPTSQISVIGNLVGARGAAQMGWKECALCLFSLGMVHYLVLFITLYQRLSGSNRIPARLRPVFFLFVAAPSMASLAWTSICGSFDILSKILFFLALFLFMSLVSCKPTWKRIIFLTGG